jgi:hypothetical protein
MSLRDDIEDVVTQLTVLFEEMQHQNDRVAAIACAAWLDDMLSGIIATRFIPLGTDWKERVFDAQTAPLTTMHGKIVIGYALGLYGPKTRADMDHIRWIRNQFAHRADPILFTQPEIAARCMKLQTARMPNPSGLPLPRVLDDHSPPKDHYIQSSLRISGRLLTAARASHTRERPKYPDTLP